MAKREIKKVDYALSHIDSKIFDKGWRYNNNLSGSKLLFAIAAQRDKEGNLPQEWEISIPDLCEYIGYDKDRNGYRLVRDGLKNLAENPLYYASEEIDPKTGFPIREQRIMWFNSYEISTKSLKAHLYLNPQIMPVINKIGTHLKVAPKYIKDFNSTYATWLYPHLRKIANQDFAILRMTMREIVRYNFLEKKPAYTTSKDANKNILSKVLGVKIIKGTDDCEELPKGAMEEVNTTTDLEVSCKVLRTGRKVEGVEFNVRFKPGSYEDITKQVRQIKKDPKLTPHEKASFGNKVKAGEMHFHPTNVPVEPTKEHLIDISTLDDLAKVEGISITQLAKKMGYKRHSIQKDKYYKVIKRTLNKRKL